MNEFTEDQFLIIDSKGKVICEGDETDVRRELEDILDEIRNDENCPYYPGGLLHLAKIVRTVEIY